MDYEDVVFYEIIDNLNFEEMEYFDFGTVLTRSYFCLWFNISIYLFKTHLFYVYFLSTAFL